MTSKTSYPHFMSVPLGFVLESVVRYPQVRFIVLSNLITFTGVFAFGWRVPEILLMYWIDSLIWGIFVGIKIYYSKADYYLHEGYNKDEAEEIPKIYNLGKTVGFLGFYLFLMCIIGQFVFPFAGYNPAMVIQGQYSLAVTRHIFIASAFFFASHLLSFFKDYLGKEEYWKKTTGELRASAFSRHALFHHVLFFGAFMSQYVIQSMIILYSLIFLKIFADITGYLHDHNIAVPQKKEDEAIIVIDNK